MNNDTQTPSTPLLRILPILFALLYLLFPSQNPTADAYDYAAGLKWGFDLFEAHHLLHQVPFWLVYKFLTALGIDIDTLKLCTGINALHCGLLLYGLDKVLQLRNVHSTARVFAMLAVGFSACVMRFSTINEVYILPLLISIAGTYWVEKSVRTKSFKQGFLGINLLVFAVAFHQVQIWWLVAMTFYLIQTKSWSLFTWLRLPIFLVALLYHIVAVTYSGISNNFWSGWNLFTEVYQKEGGLEGFNINLNHFILTGLALLRSWVTIPTNLDDKVVLSFSVLGILFLAFACFVYVFKEKLKPIFSWELVGILALVAFCFISLGNVEFLTGLPVLVVLYLTRFKFNSNVSLGLIIGLVLCNIPAGLYYQYAINISATEELYALHEQTNKLALMVRKPELDSYSLYRTGKPAEWVYYPFSVSDCDRIRNNNSCFYTDIIQSANKVSRANYLLDIKVLQWAQDNLKENATKSLLLGTEIEINEYCAP